MNISYINIEHIHLCICKERSIWIIYCCAVPYQSEREHGRIYTVICGQCLYCFVRWAFVFKAVGIWHSQYLHIAYIYLYTWYTFVCIFMYLCWGRYINRILICNLWYVPVAPTNCIAKKYNNLISIATNAHAVRYLRLCSAGALYTTRSKVHTHPVIVFKLIFYIPICTLYVNCCVHFFMVPDIKKSSHCTIILLCLRKYVYINMRMNLLASVQFIRAIGNIVAI